MRSTKSCLRRIGILSIEYYHTEVDGLWPLFRTSVDADMGEDGQIESSNVLSGAKQHDRSRKHGAWVSDSSVDVVFVSVACASGYVAA